MLNLDSTVDSKKCAATALEHEKTALPSGKRNIFLTKLETTFSVFSKKESCLKSARPGIPSGIPKKWPPKNNYGSFLGGFPKTSYKSGSA